MTKLSITPSRWVKCSRLGALCALASRNRVTLIKRIVYIQRPKCSWSCCFYLNLYFSFSFFFYPALNHSIGTQLSSVRLGRLNVPARQAEISLICLSENWKGYWIKITDVYELRPSSFRCKPACGISTAGTLRQL